MIRKAMQWLAGVALALGTVAVQAAPTITYYHNDFAGSPVAATNAAGQVIWRESYRPFGERLTNAPLAKGNVVWFTSRRQDAESGLVYMGARYYDPVVGRFYSTDPKGFDEGNVHSHNRYTYANNNPYRFKDPDGKQALPALAPPPLPSSQYRPAPIAGRPSEGQQLRALEGFASDRSNSAWALTTPGFSLSDLATIAIGGYLGLDLWGRASSLIFSESVEGTARGRAPEFQGGSVTESGFIEAVSRWLGDNPKEASPGRFVSGDGTRQVRFGKHETTGPRLHGHFEAYDRPGGRVVENTSVDIKPDP